MGNTFLEENINKFRHPSSKHSLAPSFFFVHSHLIKHPQSSPSSTAIDLSD